MMAQVSQTVRITFSPLYQVFQAFNSAVVKYPFISGVVITGLKTSAADLFAQKVVEKKENIDWKRFGTFTAFGYIYLGGFQYVFYTRIIGNLAKPLLKLIGPEYQVAMLTILDQFIYHPFVYLPAFYCTKGAMNQQGLSQIYDRFKTEFLTNCKALWAVWLPAQIINFKYIPMHFRVPYIAAVSFVWTVILSQMRGQTEETTDQTVQQPYEYKQLQEAPQPIPQEIMLSNTKFQDNRRYSDFDIVNFNQEDLSLKQVREQCQLTNPAITKTTQTQTGKSIGITEEDKGSQQSIQNKLFGYYLRDQYDQHSSLQLSAMSYTRPEGSYKIKAQ